MPPPPKPKSLLTPQSLNSVAHSHNTAVMKMNAGGKPKKIFKVNDLVWAKEGNSFWWPGQIISQETSLSVCVQWFGVNDSLRSYIPMNRLREFKSEQANRYLMSEDLSRHDKLMLETSVQCAILLQT
eukprot:UN28121